MTDFEKVQIGFDIAFVAFAITGIIGLVCVEHAINDCAWWLMKDYKTKFGYTQCWKLT